LEVKIQILNEINYPKEDKDEHHGKVISCKYNNNSFDESYHLSETDNLEKVSKKSFNESKENINYIKLENKEGLLQKEHNRKYSKILEPIFENTNYENKKIDKNNSNINFDSINNSINKYKNINEKNPDNSINNSDYHNIDEDCLTFSNVYDNNDYNKDNKRIINKEKVNCNNQNSNINYNIFIKNIDNIKNNPKNNEILQNIIDMRNNSTIRCDNIIRNFNEDEELEKDDENEELKIIEVEPESNSNICINENNSYNDTYSKKKMNILNKNSKLKKEFLANQYIILKILEKQYDRKFSLNSNQEINFFNNIKYLNISNAELPQVINYLYIFIY